MHLRRRLKCLTANSGVSCTLSRQHTDLLSLESREHTARLRLAAATNGASLCGGPSRRGWRGIPAKYLEGAAVSVSEVLRVLRRHDIDSPTDGNLSAVVGAAHARWLTEKPMPARTGPNWSEYLAGGFDALHDIQAAHPPTRPPARRRSLTADWWRAIVWCSL